MAPQNKRAAGTSKAPVVTKKAKVVASEPEDAFTLQLAPVLSALEAAELPVDCCEIFRVALPHCLAEAAADRHGFQNKMLDLAQSALVRSEEAARKAVEEAEMKASNVRAEGAVSTAEFEAAQLLATSKQSECEAKSAEVERLRSERETAKAELASAVAAKESFAVCKSELISDQEAFQKVLEQMWQPLMAGSLPVQAWRKRDKMIAELMEKLKPLALDASLIEALQVALKLRVDQRTGFAEKAFAHVVEAIEKHTALLAERVAATASEEDVHEKAVTAAEATLAEVQGRFAEQDKECDELQNRWAELETTSNTAKSAKATFDNDLQAALDEVEARKADLDAALAITATLTTLRDPPPPVVPEAELSVPVVEPMCTMEVEAVPVAAAA
jgi:hypothetical protein